MHPTERQLIDFVLAEIGEKDHRRVERHLAEPCPVCEELVSAYRELFEAMRTDSTPEPPAEWVERAVALGRPSWRVKVREWCGKLREELGGVVFDSLASPGLAPMGVRSGETERRLRFESASVELDLRLEPLGRGGVVTGQLLQLDPHPEPLAGARYLLTAGVAEAIAGITDEFGEFSEELPVLGKLRVRVIVADHLATFEIPEAPSAGG